MDKKYYDELADKYAQSRCIEPFILSELMRGSKAHSISKVLELGCGTGIYLHSLVSITGYQGFGIDPSQGMLAHAVSADNTYFANGTAEFLPFKSNSFDFLFSVNVLHHVPDIGPLFQEAMRVLKSNGLVCSITDSGKMIRGREPLATYWPSTIEVDLKRYHSIESIKELMISAGFIDIETNDIQSPFHIHDIKPYQDKALSCLHLISEQDYQQGLQKMKSDLIKGPVQGLSQYTCIWGYHH
jgi:ubiquinone/menaquinone biosynthesis C-methylase UbiE